MNDAFKEVMVAPVARLVAPDMPADDNEEGLANIKSGEVLDHTCFYAVELRAGPGSAVISSWEDEKVLPSFICPIPPSFLSKLAQVMAHLSNSLRPRKKLSCLKYEMFYPGLTKDMRILTQFCWSFSMVSKTYLHIYAFAPLSLQFCQCY